MGVDFFLSRLFHVETLKKMCGFWLVRGSTGVKPWEWLESHSGDKQCFFQCCHLVLFLPQCWQGATKSGMNMFYINTISSTQIRKCCFLDSDSTSAWCSRSHVIDKTWVKNSAHLLTKDLDEFRAQHWHDLLWLMQEGLVHPTKMHRWNLKPFGPIHGKNGWFPNHFAFQQTDVGTQA